MSDKAITARLKQVEQLRRLCLSLAKAKPVEKAPSAPAATAQIAPVSTERNPDWEKTPEVLE